MERLDNYYTKTTAIGIVCAEAGCGRPTAEKALKELAEAGTITFVKPAFSHAQLISKDDVAKIVSHIKNNGTM
jgi:hypothetical protein